MYSLQTLIKLPGWKLGLQTIWEAEQEYSGSKDPHSKDTWGSDGKGMINTDIYSNSDPTDNKQAWVRAHAGAPDTSDVTDPSFPGGFAGKCKTGQAWKFTQGQGWRCSGEVAWQQEVYFPSVTSAGDRHCLVQRV